MGHIQGTSRDQIILFPESIDEYISDDNPVRFIDAFVESLDLKELGFLRSQPKATGRPPYDPADLLKLYLYGYFNRTRSSRKLERGGSTTAEEKSAFTQPMPAPYALSNQDTRRAGREGRPPGEYEEVIERMEERVRGDDAARPREHMAPWLSNHPVIRPPSQTFRKQNRASPVEEEALFAPYVRRLISWTQRCSRARIRTCRAPNFVL